MKKQLSTKKALMLSVLSLCLCLAMLLGTTFAWFTDEVTSSGNKIVSGSLKVDLELLARDGNWISIKESKAPIFTYENWEPGYTDVKILKIENEGSLALKWVAQFVSDVELSKLADVIDVYVCPSETELKYADITRDLTGYKYAGTVAEFVNTVEQTTHGSLEAGECAYLGIALKMRESADNEYQDLTLGAFDIKIFATQNTVEKDSFDENYDKGANFAWNGAVDTDWYDASADTFTIYTAEELAGLSKLMWDGNNLAGKTVKLGGNIDLANRPWQPIGRMINTSGAGANSTFKGNFDGQGYTIYNLNVKTTDADHTNKGAGLFGAITGNISNLNVENATVSTSHWAGVIAGCIEGSVTNCSVKNATITCSTELLGTKWDNGDKAGAIAGYASKGTITDCTVTNATITAYRDLGAIAGGSYNPVENCTVSNVTLIKDNSNDYKGVADDNTINPYVGTVYGGAAVNATGDVSIVISSPVADNESLKDALTADEENIVVHLTSDVTYEVSSWQTFAMGTANTKTVTVIGNGYTVTFDLRDSDWSHVTTNGAKLILKDMTIASSGYNSGHWKRNGVAFGCEVEMEDVVSCPIILENNAELTDVTLNSTDSVYALWIYSQDVDVNINGLTVNGGRGIKIADEDADLGVVDLSVANAKFNTTAKAAILVTSTVGANITLSDVDIANVKADTEHEVWVDEERPASYNAVIVTGGSKISEKTTTVADKAALTSLMTNAVPGQTVVLGGDVDLGTTQLAVTEGVTIDLNGNALTTSFTHGGISLKNGASIKNGTINHTSTVAAIKAFDGASIENVTINLTLPATNKVVTGIAVQNGAHVTAIKNVTVTGATQGIELGKGAKVDLIENANVTAVTNGTAQGIALQINAGNVGKAVNCTFNGDAYGVHMMLNGEFTVALELDDCTVTGGTAALYAHDEVGISNVTNCSLTLTYDAETVFNGAFTWTFEDECKGVVTLNKPN